MSPEVAADPGFLAAFAELARRIAASLSEAPAGVLPVRMVVAGGAAMHIYTGARVSRDIDAAFSHRIALPADLQVFYRSADGSAQALYFDYQYNDTLGLVHEDAHDESVPVRLAGVDPGLLDVRLLAPVDLAISKLSRFADVDRGDIEQLARAGLLDEDSLRKRATEALEGYVGDLARVRASLETACRMVRGLRTATPAADR